MKLNDNLWSDSKNQSIQPIILSSTVIKDDSVHNNVRCDGCKVYPVVGLRLRCLECKDFDYCENCFMKNRQSHNHNFNAMTNKQMKVHSGIKCDGCYQTPIGGNRYKCYTCNNFDYCEKCYNRNKGIHGHNFDCIA